MCELVAYPYVYTEAIPLYKLSNHHYYYDIDNPIAKASTKWNIEMKSLEQDHIQMNGFYGKITNIKVFDYYNDDLSEIMMQYPNNSHLIINDVANQIVTINGVSPM
jgi:hypothetical protein